MSSKNRSTLKQQFISFINRVAPFNGNALIQKSEHLTVETDFFDSALMKEEDTASINSPASSVNLDFSAIDSYTINTSGSIESVFTLNVINLARGAFARIDIDKKSNDTFTISNCVISGIGNLNQQGSTSLHFVVFNVKGRLFAISDKTIVKSDAINENNTNQIATSKAVNDLKTNLEGSRSAKNQGAFTALTAPANPDYTVDTSNAFYRITDQGEVQLKGYIDTTQINPVPFVSLFTLPAPAKIGHNSVLVIPNNSGVLGSLGVGEYNEVSGVVTVVAFTGRHYIDGIIFTP